MDGREEAKTEIPGRIVSDDRPGRSRVVGELHGEPCIHRGPEQREVLRLIAEHLGLQMVRGQAASGSAFACSASAAFTCSATAANAPGSETAMSASDFRSSSMPAL